MEFIDRLRDAILRAAETDRIREPRPGVGPGPHDLSLPPQDPVFQETLLALVALVTKLDPDGEAVRTHRLPGPADIAPASVVADDADRRAGAAFADLVGGLEDFSMATLSGRQVSYACAHRPAHTRR